MSKSDELSLADVAHLEWARKLGRRGWGHVHPNPLVGCVIVNGNRTVGEGWHRAFGGPHAEIVALEEALTQARGGTVYVSLEPCNHHGKTPPCAQALLAAGVRRVVFGARDPGSESGGGADNLRAGGVEVIGPVWSEGVGRAENPAFFHTARHASPFIALKLAMTLDARIAARAGERTRVTGLEAEREVHRLRTGFDAILVGAGTVRADDPRLTVRLVPTGREAPRRLVLDPDVTMPRGAAIFQDHATVPVHVFVREDVAEAQIERLEKAGAHVHPVGRAERGLDLDAVTAICWDVGVRSILCEGGSRLADTLLRERRAHRLYMFVAPDTYGAEGVAAFPPDAGSLRWDDFAPAHAPEQHGRDTLITLDRAEG
ncbi:MAG: bifunctional diaminohydroxyphosphoribosylaminopyrimidine deaminase/5-amino-6-(5-phosphoribosylamino)uracil reductase RibD [Gemmatimonadetes bacterium]|nr:bifunctional diaminohydroxyphosphoribosylaminopyrimidine deaminase/5-amino-6-(5-phosphoribosylamino)uracil reductase RibD [Gemmatimonadota bacterium]